MVPGTTKLIDVLNCPMLPSLPSVAVQLLELTSDPNVNIKDIAKLVSTDQALSAKVLKTVNSSYYGLSSACGSIDRALGYLGLNTVKSLVLGFSLVETTALSGDSGFDLMGHWRRAIMGATGARAIAKQLALGDPDEVFTAALFQDMGMLAAFVVLKDEYASIVDGVPHRVVCNAEVDAYGFDHAEAGEALANLWNLPASICYAIRYHHDPTQADAKQGDVDMVRAAALGTLAADAMCSKSAQVAIARLQERTAQWFGDASAIEIEDLLEEIAESSKTLAKLFDQDIGEIPDPAMLMAQAQAKGLELQITAQQQADALAREAVTDGLTKIANRKRFDAEYTALFSEALANGRKFSVLFFDADKFKSVNDTYGHAAGDAVLVELASRASSAVGSSGLVCRYGGEEFVVLLSDTGVERAAVIAEKIRASIADAPFDLSAVDDTPDELPVTVSIGVSGTDAGESSRLDNAEVLVQEADKGVYAAKNAGRNNVQVWGRFTRRLSDMPSEDTISESQGSTAGKVGVEEPAAIIHAPGDSMLLVEDDALAATLILSLLKRRTSMQIDWVRTGHEALSLVEEIAERGENPYSVIVCDLQLPGSHGFEILEAARSHALLREVPFFVLTAHTEDSLRERSESLGATDFIGKNEFCKNMGGWLNRLVASGAIKQAA